MEMAENSTKTGFEQLLKILGRMIAVCAAAFVIMAHEGFGPMYFDAVGKALFWTGMVSIPVWSLNQDVLRIASGRVLALGLFAIQLFLVFYTFGKLQALTFITLTPLCFVQCLIFMLPFMLIRKRHSGIWY
jgi:hypothetical protein